MIKKFDGKVPKSFEQGKVLLFSPEDEPKIKGVLSESMSELLSIILPNSEFTNQTLKSLSPKGELKELKFSWKRNNKNPVENLLIEAQLLKLKFNEKTQQKN